MLKISFPVALGILFIGLKLAGVVTWGWHLVLLPLYIIPLIVFLFLISAYIYYSIWQWTDSKIPEDKEDE